MMFLNKPRLLEGRTPYRTIATVLTTLVVGALGCSDTAPTLTADGDLVQIQQAAVIFDEVKKVYICTETGATMNAVGATYQDFTNFEGKCLYGEWANPDGPDLDYDPLEPSRTDFDDSKPQRAGQPITVATDEAGRHFRICHTGADVGTFWDQGSTYADWDAWRNACLAGSYNSGDLEVEYSVNHRERVKDDDSCKEEFDATLKVQPPIGVYSDDLGRIYRICYTGADVGTFYDSSGIDAFNEWRAECLAGAAGGGGSLSGILPANILYSLDPDTGEFTTSDCGKPLTDDTNQKAQHPPITVHTDGNGNHYRICHTGADVGTFYDQGSTYADWDTWRNNCLAGAAGGGGAGVLPVRKSTTLQRY